MEATAHPGSIIILDFGGQYAHLIARRVRQCGVFSEILPPETPIDQLKHAAGIILSGGPQSVYDEGSPQADPKLFELGIPVLGICYGLHWMTQTLGGTVSPGHIKEYGKTKLTIVNGGGSLLADCGDSCIVWMSHGDEATELPQGFTLIGTSDTCKNAAFADESRHLYAIQFHTEVTHTEHGQDILKRFVDVCHAAPWSIESYAKHVGDQIVAEVGNKPASAEATAGKKVFMLVSGGVDSTVAFTLLNQVLGADRVVGLMVDTGLMRKGEVAMIRNAFDALGITNLHIEDASEEFFANLKDVYEPEAKRKIIGDTFLAVQKRVAGEMNINMDDGYMLGQGTIYPDTIETGGTKHADKIKTHHNRVEAIQKMIEEGRVIEPLKELYKDEVRVLGEELGLPHELVWRHPFPGPGLGVRILCAQKPDSVMPDTVTADGLTGKILPVKSVGVQGDGRTYRHALAFSIGESQEMYDTARHLATSVPNVNQQINRVLISLDPLPDQFSFTANYLTRERADLLREADSIVDTIMRQEGLYEKLWQFPVVLLPIGKKDGGQSIVLRPMDSTDAMSADARFLSIDVLKKMSDAIKNHPALKDHIDYVFLDLTNKPPATIEWE
ncbi:MAG: synthase [Candidatus Peribacteria bacterium]|nr:synthase [Candidatus Peribacteria bacterium]